MALNLWKLASSARCWSRAVHWCHEPLFQVALQELFERDLFTGGPGFEPGKEYPVAPGLSALLFEVLMRVLVRIKTIRASRNPASRKL